MGLFITAIAVLVGIGIWRCMDLFYGVDDERVRIHVEQEDDGRWFGYADGLPGVMAYGTDRADAFINTLALALCVLAERAP